MTATVLAKPLAPQAAATASFTAVGGRIYPVNATSADITAALPQNARAGTTIVITRADSSSHVVTINRGGTDTISSGTGTVTSLTLSGQGAAITLVSDGAGHWTITHQSPGNGSYVPSTRLLRSFNPREYGAVMDGVTDDSAALAACFTAMKTSGKATGTLVIDGSLAASGVLDGGYSNVTASANWGTGPGPRFKLAVDGALIPLGNTGLEIRGFVGGDFEARIVGGGTSRSVTDAAITTAQATLTSATASFVSGDVGKVVRVEGAGYLGEAPLIARISSVTNGTTAVLDGTASHTVTGAKASIRSTGLRFADCISSKFSVYGEGYAGLLFGFDGNQNSAHDIVTQSTIRELKALSCGQALSLKHLQGGFGSIIDAWDSSCVDGSVISDAADLQIVHYENYSPSTQTVGLLLDRCNNMTGGSIALGDSPAEAMLKIVGGDVGHLDSVYCTSGAATKAGLKLVEVASIDIDRSQSNLCSVGLHIKGGGANGIRVKNQVSLTGDTVGTKIEAGPSSSYMEMVDIHGYWNFTGSEAVRIESSVTGGRIKLRGQVDSSVNQSGGSGKYTVDCQASSVLLDVQGLTQLANNGAVAGGVNHVSTANLIGTDQARLGNGPAPLTPSVVKIADVNSLSLASSTTETVLVAATIKANSISAGAHYKIKARGTFDNIATSGTLTIRDKHGTQVMFFLPLGSYASAQTGAVWEIELDVIYTSVGSSAAIVTNGVYRSTITGDTQRMARGTTTGNTTVDQDLALTAQWATSNAGNVWRTDTATIEKVA